MPEPLVSVVVPARNEEAFIGVALRSVAAQTHPGEEIEVVVAVNGSQDRTAQVAYEVAEELDGVAQVNGTHPPSVRVLHEVPAGLSRAKNAGVRAARGRLVIFLDADSRMSPALVATVAQRAAAGERAASIQVVADGRDPIDRAFFWAIEHGKRLVGTRANMFWCERALFESLGGFNEALNHAEDLDFMVRAKRAGIRVGHIHDGWIATSPRRLHAGPMRIGMFRMLGRWVLGNVGIGRRWPY